MPIPETQLATWSNQGSITQSSETYNSIKNVLEANTTSYADKNCKVFLQVSYGNDTNNYAESDVDIVICLHDYFQSDLNTNKWFKPMARVLKNIRSRLVSDGLIKAGAAPSYYVEGLLYNVPDAKFASSYQDCLAKVLNWYQKEASKADLVCANNKYYLLRDGYATCWNQVDCVTFIQAAIKLWNEW
jgi:DNA modification methylase